jgi:hypothetical protein
MKARKVTDLHAFLVSALSGRIMDSSFSVVAAESGIDRATLHRLTRVGMPNLPLKTAEKAAAYLGYELRAVKLNGKRSR